MAKELTLSQEMDLYDAAVEFSGKVAKVHIDVNESDTEDDNGYFKFILLVLSSLDRDNVYDPDMDEVELFRDAAQEILNSEKEDYDKENTIR